MRLLALAVGFLSGLALGYFVWNWSGQRMHWTERMDAILSQADQMPPGSVVVIGDSITEYNRFETLCGRPALNAGIAWARTADWLPAAPNVTRKVPLVILAIGFNDKFSASWE